MASILVFAASQVSLQTKTRRDKIGGEDFWYANRRGSQDLWVKAPEVKHRVLLQ